MDLLNTTPVISNSTKKWLIALIGFGFIAIASGMLVTPERVWSNILLNGIFLTGLKILI